MSLAVAQRLYFEDQQVTLPGETPRENVRSDFLVGASAARLGLGAAQPWPAADAIACGGKDLGAYALGSNSRVSADKARKELGWAPQHASVLDWIECEMRL
ncbi:hypothetical protein G6F32_015651 [Rhizopus arrhizus]|nr:hypothetical protein G6F32_015651 [Rhizopus arrhizus]